jgi:D-lactate dehydrogenase (cytochrome)
MDDNTTVSGTLPSYDPPAVKNAAGYFVKDGMDLVDLFIGAEGTLAIVSGIECSVVKKPRFMYGITAFLPSEEDALHFVIMVRGDETASLPLKPVAIEFFDSNSLRIAGSRGDNGAGVSLLPGIPGNASAAVYTEFHAEDEKLIDRALALLADIIEGCRGNQGATWIACGERELGKLGRFRHAVPESVNLRIGELKKQYPEMTKLGTDMAVPDRKLIEVYRLYKRSLDVEKLEHVIFGHIGDNHLHVNILPRTVSEYERGKSLFAGWAKKAVSMGGTVSAEHGIGKLKTGLLLAMFGESGVGEMKKIKTIFDPGFLLNRGNLFEGP